MNQYERRFYEDIHKLVTIQGKILKELEKMNKPLEVDKDLKEYRSMMEKNIAKCFCVPAEFIKESDK